MPQYEFLGPYKIGELLGRGGMGNVYSGEHVKSGQVVAVKLIADHVANEPRFRRRFDKEVRAMKMLRHPGIVQLIGYGEEDGQLFYSMELVDGDTLQARIRKLKRLEWQTVLDYSIQICAALKHAHDIGITHRDLKPANLIITSEEKLKLVDFGIPKLFGDGEQTMPGSVLGTPDYMAPEQATGEGVTVRTDLYALGSVMYAMLSGRAPFKGKNATEVIESLKRDRPVPLDLLDVDIPSELVELVHQLLEKTPGDRPPTALSVMNRLKAMRAGLQKQNTLLKDDQTKVKLDFDDLDLDGETGATGNAATSIGPPAGHAGGTQRSLVSRGGPAQKGKQSPCEATVVSAVDKTLRPGDSISGEEEDDGYEGRSHFQTVDLTKRRTGIFDEEDEEQQRDQSWTQWLALVGILASISVAGYLFFIATRAPDADQMYEAAINVGDVDTIKSFLKHHPDDPRFDEVFNLQMEARKTGVLKRLSTQRKIGITALEPIEEGFVTAMSDRAQKPAEAAEKLRQWLNAFDSPDSKPDKKYRELVELARHEEIQLRQRAPQILLDPRAEKLIAEIRQTMEKSDPETARSRLNGIVNTFEAQAWAQPAVEEARKQLESLAEFSE